MYFIINYTQLWSLQNSVYLLIYVIFAVQIEYLNARVGVFFQMFQWSG